MLLLLALAELAQAGSTPGGGLLVPLLIALSGGGLFAALVTYLLGRRTSSGTVATSDAKQIFEESTRMRQEYRDEIVALRTERDQLQRALTDAREELRLAKLEAVNITSDLGQTTAELASARRRSTRARTNLRTPREESP